MKKIPSPVETARYFFRYHVFRSSPNQPALPRTLVFYVTYRCNSRCFMCRLWKTDPSDAIKNELSVNELDRILSDSLFARIEHLNINGGEPTLRDDLPQVVGRIMLKLPKLKLVTMSSNGLSPEKIIPAVKAISELCGKYKIKYSMSISLHGIEEVLTRVFRINNAFNRVKNTIEQLPPILFHNGHSLTFNCVLTDINVLGAPELLRWSTRMGIKTHFVVGEIRDRFQNECERSKVMVGEGKKDFLIQFIKNLSQEKKLTNPEAFRYHHLARFLERDESRTLACHYALGGVVLGAYGELYYCPHSKKIGDGRRHPAHSIYFSEKNRNYFRDELRNRECRICPPYTFNRHEFQKDLVKYIRFVLSGGDKAI